VLFVVEKNRGRRRNERGGEKGCSLGHKLNITDSFTGGINLFLINSVYKNDMSSYILAFFFSILSFITVIPGCILREYFNWCLQIDT